MQISGAGINSFSSMARIQKTAVPQATSNVQPVQQQQTSSAIDSDRDGDVDSGKGSNTDSDRGRSIDIRA